MITIAFVLSVIFFSISSISGYHSDCSSQIMDSLAAGKSGTGGPKRVVRRWNQDLISVIKKCRQRKINQLASSITGVDISNGNVRDMFQLCILHDRFLAEKSPFASE